MIRKRRSLGLVTATAVMSLVVAACGQTGSSPSSGGAPTGEPVAGGTLTVLMTADGQDLDPTKTTADPGTFASQIVPIFDTLIAVQQDGTIVPRIATEVTPSPDFAAWTVVLRQGVTFSDGSPYDAEALKFNWERAQRPESARTTIAKTFTNITVVDPQTLRVELAGPNPNFPVHLAGALGMNGSPKAIQDMGDRYSVSPVGAGPFILEQRVPGSSYTYTKNPNYWQEGKPYLDKLVVNIMPETAQANVSFKAGEADLLHGAQPMAFDGLEAAGFEMLKSPMYGGLSIWANTTKAPTDDVRVRRALAAVMNMEDVNEKAARGLGEPVYTYFPESSPYYDADQPLPWGGNKDEAQALIDEYIAEHGGEPLEIELLFSTTAYATAFSQQIEENLENISLKIVQATPASSLERVYNDNFQLAAGSFAGFDPSLELTERLRCGSGGNVANYCNPAMDAALTAAALAPTVEEKKPHYAEVVRILNEDVPSLLYRRQTPTTAVSAGIGGVETYGSGYLTFENMWKSE